MADDRGLARRMAAGDRRAYEEFVDSYGPRIHRLVKRHVSNSSDAEDVTQEVFIEVYRSIDRFRGNSALMTWVYRIAVNHCLRHQQRARPESVAFDDVLEGFADGKSDPAESASRSELRVKVQQALDELSGDHRTVVILHELHGMTYTECAEALEIPVGTVKSRLSNAFKRLRRGLSDYVLGDPAAACAPVSETLR